MPEFSFGEVVQLARVSRNQLIALLRSEVVKASARDIGGTGNQRRFSSRDVFTARVAAGVRRLRMPDRHVKLIVEAVVTLFVKHPDTEVIVAVVVPGRNGRPAHVTAWAGHRRDLRAETLAAYVMAEPVALLIQVDVLYLELRAPLGPVAGW